MSDPGPAATPPNSAERVRPLARFSAYGFLKNQRYFEPFLVLALLDKGLDFLTIGLLFAFKELVVNLVEIPSGAWADAWGRRGVMVASMLAYVGSFTIFGLADSTLALAAAMAAYGFGDAFRTGTHKAMIFAWLQHQGRAGERTRVYGFTRSWSKRGSALSGLVAAALVLALDDLDVIFFAAIPAYALNVVNLLGYPPEVDAPDRPDHGARPLARAWSTARRCFSTPSMRAVLVDSMAFEGVFHAVKDYLQPVLLAASVQWLATASLSEIQRSALLVGPVYFVLHMISSAASRRAHAVVERLGDEDRAASWIWWGALAGFGAIAGGAGLDLMPATILGFVTLHALQNLWRPILVSRVDAANSDGDGATVLSVESQSRRTATMVLAPVVGAMIDASGSLWPVGAVGVAIAAIALAARGRPGPPERA